MKGTEAQEIVLKPFRGPTRRSRAQRSIVQMFGGQPAAGDGAGGGAADDGVDNVHKKDNYKALVQS